MIALYYHELFIQHLANYAHVESPQRLKAVMERVSEHPVGDQLTIIEARAAEQTWLERVHDGRYVNSILSLATDSEVILDGGDTVATAASPRAALFAAGAGVQAVRAVLNKDFPAAFCAVRPPGHHAEKGRAMGFCFFNNIAIAAADLLANAGLSRVAIVDWDIHHGNGTEHMFLENPQVLYISLHQHPHYPGTGSSETTGQGDGTGYTVNIPMGAGAGDNDYLAAFDTRVLPAIDDFQPEFILISAGFDGHRDDPLSATLLSTPVYGEMTRLLKRAAASHCDGRIVSFLEGGYNLDALAASVEAHLLALSE